MLALYGDIPHFNQNGNLWGAGKADILIIDWYPVETDRSGCSRTGVHVLTTGPKHFKNVRAIVDAKTPGTPIWLMVQTHKNLAPSCHKKQLPTRRNSASRSATASTTQRCPGIAFHTFDNSGYTMDERRNPKMVGWMRDDRRPGPRRDVPVGRRRRAHPSRGGSLSSGRAPRRSARRAGA